MAAMTPTSYAVLGLLALKPWTTYELAKQMAVSLRNFWPRAESRLYEEPKKLVAHGFAEVTHERVGHRPRSIYRITDAGRAALREWLDDPGEMPSLEFEALIKVFFAEQGTKEQLLATLASVRERAEERLAVDARWARHYLDGGAQFPERMAVLTLVGRLQGELDRVVAEWAAWAEETAASWPDDLRAAPPAWDALEEVAARGGLPATAAVAAPLGPQRPTRRSRRR